MERRHFFPLQVKHSNIYIPKLPRTRTTHTYCTVSHSPTHHHSSQSTLSPMENQAKRSKQSSSSSGSRRSLKRKLDEDFEDDRKVSSHEDLAPEVRTQVEILESTFSSTEADRASAKRAIHVLSELAKNGNSKSRFPFHFYRIRNFTCTCTVLLM